MEEGTAQPRVVLVVPKQHVKTVKSALERSNQLDRNSKITLEPQGDTSTASKESGQDEHASRGQMLDSSQDDVELATSRATHEQGNSVQQPQFPALVFDVVSGEYVDPSVLEDRIRSREGGQRRPTSSEPERSSGTTTTQNPFPRLQFDAATGEYVDPSAIGRNDQNEDEANKPSLTAAPAMPSGDVHADAAFPRLHFDPVSSEYVNQSTLEKGDYQRMQIPTTIPCRSIDEEAHELKAELLEQLSLKHLSQDISLSYHIPSTISDGSPVSKSPVHRALKRALDALPEEVLIDLRLTPEALVSAFPEGYSVYKPMILLPHNAFSSEAWKALISTHPSDSSLLQPLWQGIAEAVDATHVAINSPIPLRKCDIETERPSQGTIHPLIHPTLRFPQRCFEKTAQDNILRSPSNLSPIYDDFGPTPTPQTLSSPTPSDFADALWVTTKQNGIWQTWAPLYTMFSRGNIREKTRILHHPSVARAFNEPSAAADLYAGIGYFAFSYRKSGEAFEDGIKQVLCWELNPWSVEGLRRGAEMNGWTCRVIMSKEELKSLQSRNNLNKSMYNEDFIVFQMSNEDARRTHYLLRHALPRFPIRHVNLGLLPLSKLSWGTAMAMVDDEYGGWIHAHENVGADDINSRTAVVEAEFHRLLVRWDKLRGERMQRMASVEHVERVKMYAPGVVHCVFDIAIERA
jgi:tRNA wybutosine-synthesizing protein 2